MNYRLLDPSEWDRLTTLVDPRYLPPPDAAAAAVAEEDGEIQAVLFLQLQLHMEPLIIRSSTVNFKRLHDTLHSAIADRKGLRYFAHSDSDKVNRMAEIAGMKHLVVDVWSGEVN